MLRPEEGGARAFDDTDIATPPAPAPSGRCDGFRLCLLAATIAAAACITSLLLPLACPDGEADKADADDAADDDADEEEEPEEVGSRIIIGPPLLALLEVEERAREWPCATPPARADRACCELMLLGCRAERGVVR